MRSTDPGFVCILMTVVVLIVSPSSAEPFLSAGASGGDTLMHAVRASVWLRAWLLQLDCST